MPTLTQTAYWTRRLLKIGAIALVAIIFLRITFKIITTVWQKINPPPPPPPTVSFGKLPLINFPESKNPDLKLTFRLETIQGGLPKFTEVVRVFFIPKEGPNLLGLERADQQAQRLGFEGEPQQISEKIYRWQNQANPPTALDIDINNGNFQMRYAYENDQEVINSKDLPTNQQAAQEAKNFLSSQGLLPADLATGSAEFVYLKFSPPNNLLPVSSLSEADFVRANLFRADLDGLKILPPNPRNSLVSFLFAGVKTLGKRLIEVNYHYYPLERETSATYPLKNIQTAWQEVQGGKIYVANLGQNEKGEIIIRKITLAYFDAEQPQHFLQPIFVFEGDNNFIGFVPAVDPKWTE
ncbi:hypothetical protein FJZ41_02195 [Candidatus Shapirobacteria bacterium]|nr:hypothetical protein [Candidatus Shapirobacteria bacterium]